MTRLLICSIFLLKSFTFGLLWLVLRSNITDSLFLLSALGFSLTQPRCWRRRAKVISPSVDSSVVVVFHVPVCCAVFVAFPCAVCDLVLIEIQKNVCPYTHKRKHTWLVLEGYTLQYWMKRKKLQYVHSCISVLFFKLLHIYTVSCISIPLTLILELKLSWIYTNVRHNTELLLLIIIKAASSFMGPCTQLCRQVFRWNYPNLMIFGKHQLDSSIFIVTFDL